MISNINVNIRDTDAIELTAMIGKGTLSMMVIASHKLDGSWNWTRYAVTTSNKFTAIGDEWEVNRELEAEQNPLLTTMFTMAKTVLSLTKPVPKAAEAAEADVTDEDYPAVSK